jgi:hypothetical protein
MGKASNDSNIISFIVENRKFKEKPSSTFAKPLIPSLLKTETSPAFVKT